MSDLEQTPLVLGRRLLSRLQKAMLRGWIDDGAGPRKPAFDAAKEYVEQQEMDASRRPPSDRQLDYFRRAEEILERSRPGPNEVSSYMGPFALQAAAIEEIIHGAIRKVHPQYDFGPPSLSALSSIRTLLSLGSSFPPTAARSLSRMQTLLTFYIN